MLEQLFKMDLMAAFPREHRLKGLIFEYPSMVLAILVAYVVFVLKIGPNYMRDKKPFNPRALTRIFNLFQVSANVWFLSQITYFLWRYRHSDRFTLICSPPTTEQPDLDIPEDNEWLGTVSTFYLYVRILDFLDTVFFVLAKKHSHVSFLHVYHHVVVVATGYIYLRSGWGVSLYYVSLVNSMVHVVMYTYYFLSTFPQMRPYLWWKRYLTAMQISQFVLIAAHTVMVVMWNCGYPPIVLQYTVVQAVIFLILFSRFYTQTYSAVAKAARAANDKAATAAAAAAAAAATSQQSAPAPAMVYATTTSATNGRSLKCD